MTQTRRRFLSNAAMAATGLALAASAGATRPAQAKVFTDGGVAIRGFDPVAYFTDGRPVPGSPEHEASHDGATWRFATAANKAAFEADPARYAPQYGGYCAFAVASGYTAPIDPEAWSVVDDKLYLNFSKSVRSRWERDVPGNIAKADSNWPSLR